MATAWLLVLVQLGFLAWGLWDASEALVNFALTMNEAMSWRTAPYVGGKKKH